jgi:hypothetical protein
MPILIVVRLKVSAGEGGGGAMIGSSEKLCLEVFEVEFKRVNWMI